MNWEDILKGEREYSFYLGQIEKIEKMLERLYDDIEKSAIEMTKQTDLPLEQARKIIKNIQKGTIDEIEKTLEEFKQKLEMATKD
jgi:predicted transcriptional regulator|tara:strand:+ start:292 stop:546 length:255 start_codon:yes stop_codon:yes gene_type:complete